MVFFFFLSSSSDELDSSEELSLDFPFSLESLLDFLDFDGFFNSTSDPGFSRFLLRASSSF